MIKRHVDWTDYAGRKQSKDWYFHLSRAELTEKAILLMGDGDTAEDIQAKLQAVIDTKDNKFIIKTFKELLVESVGLKSADGSQFIKNDENRSLFQYSGAMDEVVLWMFMNPFEAGKFIQGMVPDDVLAEAEKAGTIKTAQIRDLSLNTEASVFPGAGVEKASPQLFEKKLVEAFQADGVDAKIPEPRAGIDGLDDLKPDPATIINAADLDAMTDEQLRALAAGDPLDEKVDTRPKWLQENRKPTKQELMKMSREELMLAYRYRLGPMSPVKQ